ncbi:MAG: ECF transporter S component [Oscillospiraceae bacterium]|nr:ECF transporter S component [Oscillospiraceae bacterium]
MNSKTKTMVGVGLLTAIVVVLQLMGTPLKLGMFAGAIALLPIVIGGALYGWKAGAWLGFAFGATVLLSGDAAPFLAISIPGTIITVLAKGSGCGAVAGLVHTLLEGRNKTLAAYAAAIAAPVVNTGIFAIGCYVFFYQDLAAWNAGAYANTTAYIFLSLIGLNFVTELGTSVVLAPVITRLIKIGKKQ